MLIGIALAASSVRAASAQVSTRGQPKTPFAVADFAKLRWLEGAWAGTSDSSRAFFERLHFADDTTIDITYYTDAAFSHEVGTGRIYLSVGRVFHTMGPDRWGATYIDQNGVHFVPQVNTQSSLSWSKQSNDEWTVTMRSGFVGRDRLTIYRMRRVRP